MSANQPFFAIATMARVHGVSTSSARLAILRGLSGRDRHA